MGETEQAVKSLESALELGLATDIVTGKLEALRNGNVALSIAEKCGVPVERIEEGLKVKEMIEAIPRVPTAGSKWYVLDMKWVKQWQDYIYFDLLLNPSSATPQTST